MPEQPHKHTTKTKAQMFVTLRREILAARLKITSMRDRGARQHPSCAIWLRWMCHRRAGRCPITQRAQGRGDHGCCCREKLRPEQPG